MTQSLLNSNLIGLAKERYTKDGVINAVPESKILTDIIPFDGDKVGLHFNTPVQLTNEHGFSYSAPGTRISVATPSTFQMGNAQIDPFQTMIISLMDYETFFRAFDKGEAAFQSALDLQMKVMGESAIKKTEGQLLYGKDFTARISACSSSTSPAVLTVTTGEWAGGTWAGEEGASYDFWEGTSTKANTNAPLVISAIDPVAKTITVTGNNTDIAAINTYVAANPGSGGLTSAGSGVTTRGDQEMYGFKTIMTNTGNLFNINAANYSLWRSNTFSAGNASLTFAKIQTFVAQLVTRGLRGKLVFCINPITWANLLTDQASLRMYDSSYSAAEVEQGSKSIKFKSQNGELEIISHIYVKEGDAFAFQPEYAKRIGSTDWTLGVPGSMNGEVFVQDPTTGAATYRMYTQQQVFLEKPATAGYINNIANY